MTNTTPKVRFDHDAPVSICSSSDSRYLVQNGVRFTYAELDRVTRKFVPEPTMIPEGEFSEPELRNQIASLIMQMRELQKQLGESMAQLDAACRKAGADGK